MRPESPALRAALAAAEAAAGIIRERYFAHRQDPKRLQVDTKPDQSPVTEADRAVERAIEEILRAGFPDYGFYGEETGRRGAERAWQWLVDPIDGTKSFLAGLGQFVSTQIALMHGDEFELGVSSAPIAEEVAWAQRGAGAWREQRPLRVSRVARLEDAALSFGNVHSLTRDARWQRFGALICRVRHRRGFGDWFQYHRLAEGTLDVVLESDVTILDVAALALIVREAGGVTSDLEGNPLTLHSTSILASNGLLHQAVLDALRA